jgi:hypothetical protein
MKLTKALLATLALTTLAFAGCSHSDDSNPNPIPDHLDFVPQSGPALDAQDISNINTFLEENKNDSPADFLLDGKTQKTRDQNAKKYAKLSPELKAVVNDLKTKCTIIQPTEKTEKEAILSKGQNENITVKTSSIDGDNCDLSYVSTDRQQMDYSNYVKASKSADVRAHMNYDTVETIKTPNLQKLLKYTSSKFSGAADSIMYFRSGSVDTHYMTATFSMSGETLSGRVSVSGTMKYLLKKGSAEVVVHLIVIGLDPDKDLLISGHGVTKEQGKMNFTFYLNGTKLDADGLRKFQEIANSFEDSGDQINDDGTIDTETFNSYSGN